MHRRRSGSGRWVMGGAEWSRPGVRGGTIIGMGGQGKWVGARGGARPRGGRDAPKGRRPPGERRRGTRGSGLRRGTGEGARPTRGAAARVVGSRLLTAGRWGRGPHPASTPCQAGVVSRTVNRPGTSAEHGFQAPEVRPGCRTVEADQDIHPTPANPRAPQRCREVGSRTGSRTAWAWRWLHRGSRPAGPRGTLASAAGGGRGPRRGVADVEDVEAGSRDVPESAPRASSTRWFQ